MGFGHPSVQLIISGAFYAIWQLAGQYCALCLQPWLQPHPVFSLELSSSSGGQMRCGSMEQWSQALFHMFNSIANSSEAEVVPQALCKGRTVVMLALHEMSTLLGLLSLVSPAASPTALSLTA